jgi:hypothetical protein
MKLRSHHGEEKLNGSTALEAKIIPKIVAVYILCYQ